MENKEYTFENIQEFYESLGKSLNPTVTKFMVWSKYKRQYDLEKEMRKIRDVFFNSKFPNHRYEVDILTDDIAIITYYNGRELMGYTHYNRSTNTKGNMYYNSFDEAVIAAFMNKYNSGREDGVGIIFRAMGMNEK